jgi:uncharacterized protein YjiS (DUF1127 family)
MFVFHAIAGPSGTHRRTGNNAAALFSRAKSRFLLWRRRRKAVAALEALSDRSLQDMGIARSEIAAAVDAHLQGAAPYPTR